MANYIFFIRYKSEFVFKYNVIKDRYGESMVCVPEMAQMTIALDNEKIKFDNHYIDKIAFSFCYNK